MRWEGRRQSDNVEDRRGMRISRGGLVGGGLGTIAIALLIMFMGGDPTAVLQGVGEGPVQTTNEPFTESPEEAKWHKDATLTLASTEDTWSAILGGLGGSYRAPTLVLFNNGAVESGCGIAESAVGPFYCPSDEKLYIDLGFFKELESRFGAQGDAARNYVIAHEVGHHVQNILGISNQMREMQQRPGVGEVESNALSVRLELQADCFAGIWANQVNKEGILEAGDLEEALTAASAVGDDTLQRSAGRSVMPDSFTHGSAEQRKHWLFTGFETGSLEACDTFKAADL
jgi:predicted metalloprotease